MRDFRRRAQNVVTAARHNATGVAVAGATNPDGRGPRRKTSRLWTSIRYDVGEARVAMSLGDGIRTRPVEIVVFTDVSYAFHLENGVRGGRTYPFLSPALAAAGE